MAKLEKRVNETIFISHGVTMLDDSQPVKPFIMSFREVVFCKKPTSILMVSSHWETSVPTVNAISGPSDTIHDFDDSIIPLSPEIYKLKYPAVGAPELAMKVQELLLGSGFPEVNMDKKRGLDQGAWIPLMLMYPEADIPVCQLSVVPHKNATHHYNMGKALAPLKNEGVLIIGSGSATHNLSSINSSDDSIAPWAEEFDTWLENALVAGRFEDVVCYEERAPYAKVAHPSPEHIYPLHVAMGAAGEDAKGELIHRSWRLHTLSYASYKFKPAAA